MCPGGRSSGYLLWHVLEAHGGTLPDNCVALFCNTGLEHPRTLDFVTRMSTEWNCPITWLEYDYLADAAGGIRDPKNVSVVVNHNSASRNGRSFGILNERRKMLPNVAQRSCTVEFKNHDGGTVYPPGAELEPPEVPPRGRHPV